MGNAFVSLDAGVLMPSDAAFLGLGLPAVSNAGPPFLAVSPSVAVVVGFETVSITATLTNSGSYLTASVSGGGTISTDVPVSGVPFTYTPPADGIGVAIVTVYDATDDISEPCVITYAPIAPAPPTRPTVQWDIPPYLRGEIRRVLGYPALLSQASIEMHYPNFASELAMFQPYAILESKFAALAVRPDDAVPIFGAEHPLFATYFTPAQFTAYISIPTAPAAGAFLTVSVAGNSTVVEATTSDSNITIAQKIASAVSTADATAALAVAYSDGSVTFFANAIGKAGNNTTILLSSSDPSISVSPYGPVISGVTAGGTDPPGPYFQDPNLATPTFGYLPTIRALEGDLGQSRNFLFINQAETFIPRADEPQARVALLKRYRRELADRLSVPLDPDIASNRRGSVVRRIV
jgi:hypothetical protein